MPEGAETSRLSIVRRHASLGLALARSGTGRPSSPLKLNLCLTYWCQYRCKTCNIWQRKPKDELTTAEAAALVRENPDVNWVDVTGGEIFLRPDIDEIFDLMVAGWQRLAILHFPTNGFLTDRIVRTAERIARRGPAHTIVTVSVDGDEALNDEIRGIKGGFRRQMETFNALRRIPGIRASLGVTLSTHNLNDFDRTFAACAHACPGLTIEDVHVNVAQQSGHYYGNESLSGVAPERGSAREALRAYRRRRHRRGPVQWLENTYLDHLDRFLETGRTPMRCHSLRASCFIDPWGVVYPCITYSRPIGRLRETGMQLAPIWNSPEAIKVQQEIWAGDCPQCWTACEAYQSILGNGLLFRRTETDGPAPGKERRSAPAGV